MSSSSTEPSSKNFIDHHAHSILRDPLRLDVRGFRACWTESRSEEMIDKHVPHELHYIDMLKRLGELLGVKGEDAIVAKRSKMNEREYIRMLWDAAGISTLVVDDGFHSNSMLSIAELQHLSGRPAHQCRRIEAVLERCILETDSFAALHREFEKGLFELAPERPVALKTIMAYRGGLHLDMVAAGQAEADYAKVKAAFSAGNTRISRGVLYHYFLMQAFELAACNSVPVQVHTGLGDDDQDLLQANPALMQPLFRLPTLRYTQWVLLHCYPYVREAALMCALYPNVYMDVSLAINLVSPAADALLLEAFACAPTSKILTATDGHSIPETHWYAATIWNESITRFPAVRAASPPFDELLKVPVAE